MVETAKALWTLFLLNLGVTIVLSIVVLIPLVLLGTLAGFGNWIWSKIKKDKNEQRYYR